MSCTKRRYPDRVSADLALAVLRRKDSTRRGKQERRAYHCHACNGWHLTSMERRVSDQGLIDALRDRIADLGDPGAVVIGYAIVVEVVTPGEDGPWLKTLGDSDSTPWAQMGRVSALHQITRNELDAGWRPGEGDDQ